MSAGATWLILQHHAQAVPVSTPSTDSASPGYFALAWMLAVLVYAVVDKVRQNRRRP